MADRQRPFIEVKSQRIQERIPSGMEKGPSRTDAVRRGKRDIETRFDSDADKRGNALSNLTCLAYHTRGGKCTIGAVDGPGVSKCTDATPRRPYHSGTSTCAGLKRAGIFALDREYQIMSTFDVQAFLDSAGVARQITTYQRSETIFSQGEVGDSVIYIQKGGVKLSVVSETGREAIVAMLGPGEFCGEGGLTGQSVRKATATALTPTKALVIGKDEMVRVLHAEHALSDRFIAYMLARNIRIEEDLVGQLFNSNEKRLARTLLLLARYGMQDEPHRILPRISHATLADMVGTTRVRVSGFLKKFKRLGFIESGTAGIRVNRSLLSVVLHD